MEKERTVETVAEYGDLLRNLNLATASLAMNVAILTSYRNPDGSIGTNLPKRFLPMASTVGRNVKIDGKLGTVTYDDGTYRVVSVVEGGNETRYVQEDTCLGWDTIGELDGKSGEKGESDINMILKDYPNVTDLLHDLKSDTYRSQFIADILDDVRAHLRLKGSFDSNIVLFPSSKAGISVHIEQPKRGEVEGKSYRLDLEGFEKKVFELLRDSRSKIDEIRKQVVQLVILTVEGVA